ncbi:MAG: hypothetical protein P8129_05010 [Anaerolineae bacterium]
MPAAPRINDLLFGLYLFPYHLNNPGRMLGKLPICPTSKLLRRYLFLTVGVLAAALAVCRDMGKAWFSSLARPAAAAATPSGH